MLKIITDSASDLPINIITKYNLDVIPTPVVIDGEDYLDGKSIHTKEFYNILDDTSRDIKTYHINPTMFEEAFLPYAKNKDEVIYICFSTGIAGTFNAANIAKESVIEQYPEFDLTIIDSKCASVGFGLLVYKLLQMNSNGAPKQVLIEAAHFYVEHIRHIFTVSTLNYLVKGGRLPKWKGSIAETLDMKPIIMVDENGALKVLKTVRGRKKSLKELVLYAKENGASFHTNIVAICHGEDSEALDYIMQQSNELLQPKESLITVVGCAIGAHTGRGVVGVCFLDKDDLKFKQYLS